VAYADKLRAALAEAAALDASQEHLAAHTLLRAVLSDSPFVGDESPCEPGAIADLAQQVGRESDRQHRRHALLNTYQQC
jgi:hypothetical protein